MIEDIVKGLIVIPIIVMLWTVAAFIVLIAYEVFRG